MATRIIGQNRFSGGISESSKEGLPGSFQFSQGINIRDEPSQFSLLPAPEKVSGSVITAMVKWMVSGAPYNDNIYAYDETGTLYKQNVEGVWSVMGQFDNSHGQGMAVYDNYLYLTLDQNIAKYGPLSSDPEFLSATVGDWQTGLNDTSEFGFAPIISFKEGFAVGHGNNVAWYDGAVFTIDRLEFPPGLYVSAICQIQEFLTIGTINGTDPLTNDRGYVFAWDGTAETFNFFNNCEEGGINALVNRKNQLLSIAGSSGNIYVGYDPFEQLHQLPKLPVTSSVQVYPGAVCTWKSNVYFGFAGFSTDTNFVRGMYSWGSKSRKYPDVLNLDFIPSTGNSGSTVRITSALGLGNTMYFAWVDGTSYGIDKVEDTNDYQSIGIFESLIFDDKRIPQEKAADTLRVDHSALNPGESVSIYYRINRENGPDLNGYNLGTTHSYDATDHKPRVTRYNITGSSARFNEIQWQVTIESDGSSTPYVYGSSFKYDDLMKEEAM